MSKAAELAALIANVNKGSSLANKNLVINGAMNVAQRGTSSTSEGYQTVDRFYITINEEDNLAFTQAQSTDAPTGFSNSYKIDCTTVESALASDELAYVAYKTEAQDCMRTLNGTADAKPLTLSFWVKSNKTGTYAITLYKPDNTARSLGKTYTISSANTWEYKTVTFEGDTSGGGLNDDNGEGLNFYFTLMAGSDWTSSDGTSWHNYANASFSYGHNVNMFDNTANEWLLTGVQLEIGEKATPFEHEPFSVTLKKCERYFEKTQSYSTAGTSWESAGGVSLRDGTASTVVRYYRFNYKTRKRASSPTITTYDALSASGKCKIDSTQGITTVIFSNGEGSWCMYPDTSISHYGISAMAWTSESEL